MKKAYMNWSGGKDSALCLYQVRQAATWEVTCLLTSVDQAHERISMHGVRNTLLIQQAQAIGLPLTMVNLPENPDMVTYEALMAKQVRQLKQQRIDNALFGDIFLEDLRTYRETQLRKLGVEAVFPLWKKPTSDLMHAFIELGFKARIVCVNEQYLGKEFCGRLIDQQLVQDLPANVDVCGENGEYHSFVFDGPIFQQPVSYSIGAIVHRTYAAPRSPDNDAKQPRQRYGFYYCDLIPAS